MSIEKMWGGMKTQRSNNFFRSIMYISKKLFFSGAGDPRGEGGEGVRDEMEIP